MTPQCLLLLFGSLFFFQVCFLCPFSAVIFLQTVCRSTLHLCSAHRLMLNFCFTLPPPQKKNFSKSMIIISILLHEFEFEEFILLFSTDCSFLEYLLRRGGEQVEIITTWLDMDGFVNSAPMSFSRLSLFFTNKRREREKKQHSQGPIIARVYVLFSPAHLHCSLSLSLFSYESMTPTTNTKRTRILGRDSVAGN